MASLYVGNLDYAVDESDIYDVFREYDIVALHMKFTYCFVTLSSRIQAEDAMVHLDGTELFDKRIRIQWARSNYDPGGIFNPVTQPNYYQNLSNSASSLASSASNQSSASISKPPSVTSIPNTPASSDLLQPVSENTLLECEICFVRFDYSAHRPRSLPCGHSLCSLCITDTFKANADSGNDVMLCPFCRTSVGPYKRRVGQFPETFFILKMLEVESEKAKGNEEAKEKKKEEEEKKKKEEKKKEQEEEYLKFQKQIGLDSTMSGILSCKDHLESLEDLHKEQSLMKKQLKNDRKRLLAEVRLIESELMELSEQMFNIEVWIANGKNLLTKFDNIQENFTNECHDKESIECSYEAAERCCLATQRWSDISAPDIEKMNSFVKKRKQREDEDIAELSEHLNKLNRSSQTSQEETSHALLASGSSQSIQNPRMKITNKEKHGKILLKPYDSISGEDSDLGSDQETMSSGRPEPAKRNKSDSNISSSVRPKIVIKSDLELSSSVKPKIIFKNDSVLSSSVRPKLTIKKTEARDKSSCKSTTETRIPFNVTSTPRSFDFGSTCNPFQTNVVTTTTAALITFTTTSSVMSQSSSVSSVLGLGNSNIKTSTLKETTGNMNLVSNTSSAAGLPSFSSSNTSTISSPFSMGNLSHPSSSSSNLPTSAAETSFRNTPPSASSRLTSSEDTTARNTLATASVRPKVNSEFVQTEPSFFLGNDLSKSESSLLSKYEPRKTTFGEHADLRKKLNVAFKDLFPKLRFECSNVGISKVNTTSFATKTATTATTANSISASTSACNSATLGNPSSSSIKKRCMRNMNFPTSSPVSSFVDTTLDDRLDALDDRLDATLRNVMSSGFSFPNPVSAQSNSSNANLFTFNISPVPSKSELNLEKSLENSTRLLEETQPQFSFPSATLTQNKVSNKNYFTFSNGLDGKAQDNTPSVKLKGFKFSSQINDNDKTQSSTPQSLPSFNFTMSPGKFSGISFTSCTSTKTVDSTNAVTSTALSFTNSSSVPKFSSFNQESLEKPISFNLKPKSFNFSFRKINEDSYFSNSDDERT